MTTRRMLGSIVLTLASSALVFGCNGDATTAPEGELPPAALPNASASVSAAAQVPWEGKLCVRQENVPSIRVTNGIVHMRNQISEGDGVGDVEGWITGTWNGEIHAATGDAVLRGEFHIDVARLFGNEVDGTFRGQSQGLVRNGLFEGDGVGHGTGDLTGLKMHIHFVGAGGVGSEFGLSGTIVDPSGALAEPATHDPGTCD